MAGRATWRRAEPHDRAVIFTLWAALNAEDPAEAPPPRAYLEKTWDVLAAAPGRGRFVVLEVDDVAQGYALLISFWSNEQGGELCTVDELYVAPAARGRGHGSALLRALAAGSPLWPGRPVGIDLEVSPHNARARRLYERLGFREIRNRFMRCPTAPPVAGA